MERDQQVSLDVKRLYKMLFKTPEEKKLIPIFIALLAFFSFLEISTFFFATLVLTIIFASKKLIGLKFNLRRSILFAILILLLSFASFKAFGSFSGSHFFSLQFSTFAQNVAFPFLHSYL